MINCVFWDRMHGDTKQWKRDETNGWKIAQNYYVKLQHGNARNETKTKCRKSHSYSSPIISECEWAHIKCATVWHSSEHECVCACIEWARYETHHTLNKVKIEKLKHTFTYLFTLCLCDHITQTRRTLRPSHFTAYRLFSLSSSRSLAS